MIAASCWEGTTFGASAADAAAHTIPASLRQSSSGKVNPSPPLLPFLQAKLISEVS